MGRTAIVLWIVIISGAGIGVPAAVWVTWQDFKSPARDPVTAPSIAREPTGTMQPSPSELAELARLRRAATDLRSRLTTYNMQIIQQQQTESAKLKDPEPELRQSIEQQYEDAALRWKQYKSQLRARYGTIPAE